MSAQQQQRAMSPATASRLAALIVTDAEQLQERAQDHGVTAFVGRALQRERPNERFLQSTIRNLASANRRKDERVMWAAWEAEQQQQQQQQQRGQQRQRHKEDGGNGSSGGRRYSRSRSRDRSRSARRDGSPAVQRIRRSRSRSRDRSSRGRGRRRDSPSRSSSRSWSEVSQGEAVQPAGVAAGAAAAAAGVAGRLLGPGSRSDDGATSSGGSSSSSSEGVVDVDPGHKGATAADAEDVAAAAETSDAEKDEQLVQWLASSRAVKGRGSVGPRADMPGPFLQAPDELQQLQQGVTKGPARPAWLPQQEPGARMAPDAGFLHGVLRAQGVVGAAAGAVEKISRQGDMQESKKKRRRATGSSSDSSDSGGSCSEGGSRKRRSSKHKKDKRKKKEKRSKHKKHKKKRHKD